MQEANIDVTKIDKAEIYVGKKGKYVRLRLLEKPDQYGNDGFVAQDISKERRAAGERGPIIGNWKHIERRQAQAETNSEAEAITMDEDDIPF